MQNNELADILDSAYDYHCKCKYKKGDRPFCRVLQWGITQLWSGVNLTNATQICKQSSF